MFCRAGEGAMLGTRRRSIPPMRGCTMPAPTPVPLRQALWQRARRGQPTAAIARALDLPARTVRHLRHRLDDQGQAALAPSYAACGRPRTRARDALREEALALRRAHPTWGGGLIRVLLRHDHPRADLPAERTLQRWFHETGLGPAPKGRRPAAAESARAMCPHEVWQMDASERIPLKGGRRCSWLRVVDECSG